jgi:phenylacetate-CoA ligase
VLVIGEGLEDCDRNLVEKVFNCKVYRRYSDMELGVLGQDFGDGGKYFLNWGSYFFEVLKLEKDEPADAGEIGRIVITDLFNKAFPMIRYDTGDLGVLECTDRGRFPYLKEIYGRKRDCVYTTNGLLVSPAKISVSMWGCKNIRQWQFIQTGKTMYVLKINPCYLPYDDAEIVYKLREVLGFDAEIKVELVSGIPVLSSNKRRAVICDIN